MEPSDPAAKPDGKNSLPGAQVRALAVPVDTHHVAGRVGAGVLIEPGDLELGGVERAIPAEAATLHGGQARGPDLRGVPGDYPPDTRMPRSVKAAKQFTDVQRAVGAAGDACWHRGVALRPRRDTEERQNLGRAVAFDAGSPGHARGWHFMGVQPKLPVEGAAGAARYRQSALPPRYLPGCSAGQQASDDALLRRGWLPGQTTRLAQLQAWLFSSLAAGHAHATARAGPCGEKESAARRRREPARVVEVIGAFDERIPACPGTPPRWGSRGRDPVRQQIRCLIPTGRSAGRRRRRPARTRPAPAVALRAGTGLASSPASLAPTPRAG